MEMECNLRKLGQIHRTDLCFSVLLWGVGGRGDTIRLPVSEVPKKPGINRINELA